MFDLYVYYMYLQYFDSVGSVFWKNRLPHNLYCVCGANTWRGRKTLLNPVVEQKLLLTAYKKSYMNKKPSCR